MQVKLNRERETKHMCQVFIGLTTFVVIATGGVHTRMYIYTHTRRRIHGIFFVSNQATQYNEIFYNKIVQDRYACYRSYNINCTVSMNKSEYYI